MLKREYTYSGYMHPSQEQGLDSYAMAARLYESGKPYHSESFQTLDIVGAAYDARGGQIWGYQVRYGRPLAFNTTPVMMRLFPGRWPVRT